MVDDALARSPISAEEHEMMCRHIDEIVAANDLVSSGDGWLKLSDEAVTILIVVVMEK